MYNPNMIVYGELLFIENMIIGCVLLYLTGEICGQNRWRSLKSSCLSKFRLAFGSIMCGLFSLVIFLGAKAPLMMLMEAAFAVVVCAVVFGKQKPWRQAVVFMLVTYFMGGIVMGILLVTQQQGIHTAAGIYTGDMKAAALTLFIFIGYATSKKMIKTVRNKKLFTEHTYEAEIVIGKLMIKTSAFLDTGNRLKDPMTGKPVALASAEFWEHMMKSIVRRDTVSNEEVDMAVRFSVIPYEAVGSDGLLEAIRTDHIEICGKRIKGCLVARSDRELIIGTYQERSEGYDLLISGEMIW